MRHSLPVIRLEFFIAVVGLQLVMGATSNVIADSVTLKNAEVVQGQIVSETDSQITVKVSNSSRTISWSQDVPKSEIRSIERESVEQQKERHAYEALDGWKLNANQEYSVIQYQAGIKAFNDFLIVYPGSKFADDVKTRLSLWTNELAHVEQGQFKINNQWMTPAEKKRAAAAQALVGLRLKLSDLQRRHDETVRAMEEIKTAGKQDKFIATRPPPTKIPGWWHGYYLKNLEVWRMVVQDSENAVAATEQKLATLRDELKRIQDQINDTTRRVKDTETAYSQAR